MVLNQQMFVGKALKQNKEQILLLHSEKLRFQDQRGRVLQEWHYIKQVELKAVFRNKGSATYIEVVMVHTMQLPIVKTT